MPVLPARRHRAGRSVALLASFLALPALARPADAQAPGDEPRPVAGVVVDAGSGVPVPGALVALVERNHGVFTDEEGRFTLRDLRPGSHRLVVVQLGYDSLATRLVLPEGTGAVEGVVLRLEPDPVVLEGIRVVSDRLRSRRNAVAASVRAFDQRALQSAGARDALEFLRTRTNLMPAACLGRASMGGCAYVRGRPTPVTVYIDDVHVLGGLEYLDSYRPEELYLVEVFRGGSHVRVYTTWFMEWFAKTGRRPAPVLVW